MKFYRLKKVDPRTWEVFNLSGNFVGWMNKDETAGQVMWSIGDGRLYKTKKQAAEKLLRNEMSDKI